MTSDDSTLPWEVLLYDGASAHPLEDRAVIEEPLEIAVGLPHAPAQPAFTTLRTPGMDTELALGWLLSEGVVDHVGAVRAITPALDPARPQHQRIDVTVDTIADGSPLARLSWSSSACGTCGRSAIATAIDNGRCPEPEPGLLSSAVLYQLVPSLSAAQQVFATTGGLHAAAVFEPDGRLIAVAEDVGRHNAVDKVIGLTAHDDPTQRILVVSGRVGYEIAAKAVRRGFPVLAAVGAPSSLSIRVAQATGLTLIGFLRDRRANVYTRPERLRP